MPENIRAIFDAALNSGQVPFFAVVASGKTKFNKARATEIFGPFALLAYMFWSMQGDMDAMRQSMEYMKDKMQTMEISQVKVQSDLDKYTSDVNYLTNAIKDAGFVKITK